MEIVSVPISEPSSPPVIELLSESEEEEQTTTQLCKNGISGSEKEPIVLDDNDDNDENYESRSDLEIMCERISKTTKRRLKKKRKRARSQSLTQVPKEGGEEEGGSTAPNTKKRKRPQLSKEEVEKERKNALERKRIRGMENKLLKVASKIQASHDRCMDQIEEHCLSRLSAAKENFIVLVTGPKDAGKSTFCRKLLNRFLEKGLASYHLECDPGQTEFTPPGCLALTEIIDRIDGLPFTHLRSPISCKFFGETSPADRVEEYTSCIRQLLTEFETITIDKSRSCLVVNTCGWIEDTGLAILKDICSAAKPNYFVFLDSAQKGGRIANAAVYSELCSTLSSTDDDTGSEGQTRCVSIDCWIEPNESESHLRVRPSVFRDAALFAYFGHCVEESEYNLSSASTILSSNIRSHVPYAISMGRVYVKVVHMESPQSYILSILNGSLVALCHYDETDLDESTRRHWMDDQTLPMMLEESVSKLQCLGFGVVRAVDPTTRTLYMNTPMPKEKLERVNALVKGDISLPPAVFLAQKVNSSSDRITGNSPYVSPINPNSKLYYVDDPLKAKRKGRLLGVEAKAFVENRYDIIKG